MNTMRNGQRHRRSERHGLLNHHVGVKAAAVAVAVPIPKGDPGAQRQRPLGTHPRNRGQGGSATAHASTAVHNELTRMMSEKQAARLLERLVTGLEAAFRIDANDYRLVGVLGAGTERSNHDALHAWVWREIAGGYAEEPLGDQLLPKLGQRLERRLRQWEVDQWR